MTIASNAFLVDTNILVYVHDPRDRDILTEDAEHGRVLEGVHYLNPFAFAFDLALIEHGL